MILASCLKRLLGKRKENVEVTTATMSSASQALATFCPS